MINKPAVFAGSGALAPSLGPTQEHHRVRITGSTPRPASIDELLDTRLAARLDTIDVRSNKVFAGKLQGERRSKRRGQSVEFDDFRNYVPGDDLRFIDWNIYARLDKLFIKLFLEEEDLSLHLAVDASASMDAGLDEPDAESKRLHAARIAMALGYVGLLKQNRVGATVFGGPGGVVRFDETRGRHRVQALAAFFTEHAFGSPAAGAAGRATPAGRGASLEAAMRRIAAGRSGKGVLVVLSDFFDPGGYELALRDLSAAGGFDTWCVQIVSPGEAEPERLSRSGSLGISGDVRLTDAETGVSREITVTPELIRRYKARFAAAIESLSSSCRKRGIEHLLVCTDEPVDRVVLETLRRRGLVG